MERIGVSPHQQVFQERAWFDVERFKFNMEADLISVLRNALLLDCVPYSMPRQFSAALQQETQIGLVFMFVAIRSASHLIEGGQLSSGSPERMRDCKWLLAAQV
jgi:hypothetical protein